MPAFSPYARLAALHESAPGISRKRLMLGLCSVLESPGHGQPQRREMAWARMTRLGHRPESHIAEAKPVSASIQASPLGVFFCVNRASLCALHGADPPQAL